MIVAADPAALSERRLSTRCCCRAPGPRSPSARRLRLADALCAGTTAVCSCFSGRGGPGPQCTCDALRVQHVALADAWHLQRVVRRVCGRLRICRNWRLLGCAKIRPAYRTVTPAWRWAAAAVLRWTVMGFDPPLVLLVPLQTLHGLTYGAAHLGAIQFMAQAVPPAHRLAPAQSLYALVGGGHRLPPSRHKPPASLTSPSVAAPIG